MPPLKGERETTGHQAAEHRALSTRKSALPRILGSRKSLPRGRLLASGPLEGLAAAEGTRHSRGTQRCCPSLQRWRRWPLPGRQAGALFFSLRVSALLSSPLVSSPCPSPIISKTQLTYLLTLSPPSPAPFIHIRAPTIRRTCAESLSQEVQTSFLALSSGLCAAATGSRGTAQVRVNLYSYWEESSGL